MVHMTLPPHGRDVSSPGSGVQESWIETTSTGSIPVPGRLISRLSENPTEPGAPRPITLVNAPAGFGKTAMVAAWLGSRSDAARRVLWIRCAPGGAGSLFEMLAQEIGAFLGVEPGGAGSAKDALARMLGALDRPLAIIIDDYHHATSAENDVAVAELFSVAPLLTTAVVGRRVHVLDGPLMTGAARVRVFGPNDLALTPAESLQIAQQAGLPDTERLRSALEQTAGWPLAVRAATRSPRGGEPIDPFTGLNRFALDHLEVVSDLARRMLLAAAQLDAITLDQASELSEASPAQMRGAMYELLELGALTMATGVETTEFRCHPAVHSHLDARARRSSTPEQRSALFRGRAARIGSTAPFTAFKLYCAAEAYDEAEVILAQNFTTIINETEAATRILRTLPDPLLATHPTLTAARLTLEMADPTVPISTLHLLMNVWRQALERATSAAEPPTAEMALPLLAQSMVLTRLLGDAARAGALANELESRLKATEGEEDPIEVTGQRSALETTPPPLHGSLPTYYREIASTALMAGDFTQARRNWRQLQTHAEYLISSPWNGHSHASTRTVGDVESGQRWLLASLYEQAFTEMIDGDVRRSTALITRADAYARETGSAPPGLSWVGGEIGRAHLAYELDDARLLQQALAALTPLRDRIEQWPLLLIAQAEASRRNRGVSWALSELHSGLGSIDVQRRGGNRWQEYLSGYHAMLYIVLGDFVSAQQQLDRLDPALSLTRLETARLALFAGNDVEALLIAQQIGDIETTKRQQLERCLVSACAAWACDKPSESAHAMQNAANIMEQCYLPSSLWGLPFELLREAAVAARDAGGGDLVEMIDAVPEAARSKRYGQLTEMEQRTLEAIAEHRNANEAAAALFVTAGTVKKHLASVYRKLHARGRNEAILQASRMGLLPRDYAAAVAATDG